MVVSSDSSVIQIDSTVASAQSVVPVDSSVASAQSVVPVDSSVQPELSLVPLESAIAVPSSSSIAEDVDSILREVEAEYKSPYSAKIKQQIADIQRAIRGQTLPK